MNKTTHQIKTAAIIAGLLFLSFLYSSKLSAQCVTGVSTTYLSFPGSGGTQTVYLTYDPYNSNCNLSIMPNQMWIMWFLDWNNLSITVPNNTGGERWGSITISNSGESEMMWEPYEDEDLSASSSEFVIQIYQAAGCTLPGGPVWVSSPGSACTNTSVIYSIQPISGATSYSWTVSSGGTITSGQGTTSVSITFTSTGSKTVSVRGVNSCGQGTSLSRTVSVTSAPAKPGTINGSGTVCANGTYDYYVEAVSGATSYHWQVPSGAIINSGQGTSKVSVKFGQYGGNIMVSASNSTCSSAYNSRYITVDDGSTEMYLVTGGGQTCPSGPGVPIGLSGSTFKNRYDLYRDGSNYVTTESGTGSAISFGTFTTAGTYTVRTTTQNGCTVWIPGVQVTHKTQSVAATGISASPSGTICAGTSVTLTLSGGSLGQGASWRWYRSSCGSGYIGTGTSIVVSPTVSTTYYVRAEGECNTTSCVARQVTVNPATSVSQHPQNQTVCEGSSAGFSISASGTGLTYQWQLSTNGGSTWSDISGATGSLYGFTTTTAMNNYRYRCVVSSTCSPPFTSNSATLTVNQKPVINTHPTAQTVCEGSSAGFSVSASGTGISSYQWQVSTNGGSTWSNFGSNSPGITVTASLSMNNYRYRCVVSGSCSPSVISNSATLTVNQKPVINTHPTNQTVCEGSSASFSVSASGTGLSYIWQRSTDLGSTWSDIAAGSVYSFSTTLAMNNYRYRCVVSGSCSPSVISNPATLTVNQKPVINTHPTAQTVCEGSSASFSVSATGTGLSYIWQRSTDLGSTWSDIAAGSVYSFSTTLAMNNYRYRCVVSGSCSPSVISNPATLTVNQKPVINYQSTAQTVCEGSNASFSLWASGTGLTYQWQLSTNGGSTWSDISGATSSGYSFSTTLAMNNYRYRCVVSGSCSPPAISNPATLTVNQKPVINTHPTNQTVCEGSSASFSVSASGTVLSYIWQRSTNGGSAWSDIASGPEYSFSTTLAMNNYLYRAVVSGTCSPPATSNEVVLTVNQVPIINQNPVSQIVYLDSPVTFSVVASPAGVTYQWRKDGVNLSGANSSSYFIASAGTQHAGSYSCVVTGSCGVVTSDSATLQINQAPQPDQDRNYIHTMVYREALGANPVRANLSITHVSDQIAYFDGLGRPSQTVAYRQSPTQQDIVVPVVYDALGRQYKQILPYVGESNGSFKPNALAAQEAFYLNSVSPEMIDNKPYSRTVFEASPLNRVFEQGAPGAVWQPIEGSSSGRTVKYEYRTNAVGNVKLWKVSGNNLQYGGTYAAGSLFVTEVRDENWEDKPTDEVLLHTSWEFKDFQGRVVLKRTYVKNISTVTPVETYYVYDDLGLLRYVLSPRGTEVFGTPAVGTSYAPTHANITQFCYYYRYDARRRMIEKQLPGANPVYLVYDNRDRLVLVQDGVRRENGEWAFTKYDVLNRPVATGIYIPVTSIPHQQAIDVYKEAHENAVVNLSSATGYTLPDLLMGPDISIERLLTLTYYDNYLAVTGATGLEDLTYDTHADRSFTQGYSDKVKGLVTATRVKILNNNEYTDSAKWVGTVSYYDDRYRVIQTRRHLFDGGSNGKETASTQYDFTGQVRKTRQYQQFSTATTTVHKEYDYDHAGRLLTVKQVILEDNPNLKIELVAHEYDVLGQLSKKQLHVTAGVGFQKTDYKYNIRGWLTGMNDPHNRGDDFFTMKLLYNDITELNANNEGAQFNGNISGWIWHNQNSGKRAYRYNYDAINRLQGSQFYEHTAGNWAATPKYEERNITYDLNGNILNLYRTDSQGSQLDHLVYDYIGNQLNKIGTGGLFDYDENGNMIHHGIKEFEVAYNQLNLPRSVSKLTDSISYIYTAMGEKVAKRMNNNEFQYYAGGFEYNHDKKLKMMHTEEGFVRVNDEGARNFHYNYYLKDHLGNVRVVFDPDEQVPIQQLNDYYSFGMLHTLDYNDEGASENKYLYNQKELQRDVLSSTGLNWYDYGWRMYDPQLARFHTVDPLAEYFPHQSPFVYANNNPIRYIDYLGLSASDTTYIAPDIRELTIIGTKPNNNSNSSSINFVRIWWNRLTNWWNSANPYTQTEVHDPNSQDMDWWHDSKVKGNHNVISRDNPLYERVFGWRNKRKKPKIEGDTEGKIEATIDDRYKEHLDNSNEPANEPVHNDFQWVGEESDSIIKTYLYKIDGQDTFLRDHKTSKHTGWGRPISKPYKKSK